jgi:hypothetical protein
VSAYAPVVQGSYDDRKSSTEFLSVDPSGLGSNEVVLPSLYSVWVML